jgi:gliding motility-associated-like protein
MLIVKISSAYFNRAVILTFLLFCTGLFYGQEICNNGIDDDGNGLVDLNDTIACACVVPAPSLIPNSSFEQKSCCPSSYSQLNCAQGWIQASSATSDFMNACGYIAPAIANAGLTPFPDGNGIAGVYSSTNYKEYIGACLTGPMLKDSSYSIQMSIASVPANNQLGSCGAVTYAPSDIVIYGSANCTDLPFSGSGCPPAQWLVLGSTTYTPVSSWGVITINFTPTININAIIIGAPCTLPPSYNQSSCIPYFVFDNLFLNKTSLVTSITQSGGWCSHNDILTGNSVAGATYQWYLNGVAIVGQTALTLDVSSNNLPDGIYTLATTVGNNCSRTSISVVKYAHPPAISSHGSFCKNDPPGNLTANIAGGVWGGIGITDTVNGVFDPSVAAIGNNAVYYTLPGGGDCPRADTMQVVVNDLPTASAGPDTTICSDQTITLGGSPVAGYSYSWSPSTGLSSSIASSPTLNLTNSDTVPMIANYSLITTDLASGCMALDQLVITVNPGPVITPVGPFCKVAPPVTLTASMLGGTWSGSGITNATSGIFNPALATVGDNLINYSLPGTCNGGDTILITVINAPVSNAGSDLTICSGVLDSIGSTEVAGYTYSWQPVFGLSSSTSANPIVTAVNNSTGPVSTNYVLTTSVSGCQSVDTVMVTLNPQPILQINNPPAICSPNKVDLTSPAITAGSSGGGIVSYWVDSTALIALTSPNLVGTSGTYYIKATATGGCFDIDSVVVTVSSSAAISNAGADVSVCTGDTVQIGSAATLGSTYSWSPATGLISDTVSNPMLTLVNNGATAITTAYIVTTSAGGGSCSSSDTVNVTVTPFATANAGSNQTICSTVGATLAGIIGGSASAATWSGGNGIYTPSTTDLNAVYKPSVSEITAGVVTLTLTTDDPAGSCVADTSTVTFTINAPATVNAGLDDTICAGNSVILSGVYGGAATSGMWSGGGGIFTPDSLSANTSYLPTFAEDATGNAVLVFTTDDPSGPCPAQSDSVSVYIQTAPIANAGNAQYICNGSIINLSGQIAGSATSATWSGGLGNFVPSNTTLNAVYTPAPSELALDSIVLTLTPNGPGGGLCGGLSSDVVIHFAGAPLINFSVDSASGCPVHCVNFHDLTDTTGGAALVDWAWNFGDNVLSDVQNPSHCYQQPGLYDVVLTVVSANNCSSTLTIPQFIQVFPEPVAEFEPTPNPATVTTSFITLNNLCSSDVNYWYWNFGDSDTLTTNSAGATHLYSSDSSGTYQTSLIVKNSFGCADTMMHQIIINPEFSFFIPAAFSPNNDGLNDFFGGKGMGIAKYELLIFDRWGNQIFYSDDLDKPWDGKVNHSLPLAQQDVYVWKVKITDVFRKKYNYIGTVTVIK